jgi:hypothetical protein
LPTDNPASLTLDLGTLASSPIPPSPIPTAPLHKNARSVLSAEPSAPNLASPSHQSTSTLDKPASPAHSRALPVLDSAGPIDHLAPSVHKPSSPVRDAASLNRSTEPPTLDLIDEPAPPLSSPAALSQDTALPSHNPATPANNLVLSVPGAEPSPLDSGSLGRATALPVRAPERPVYDLELPVFEPSSTTNNSAPPVLSPQPPELTSPIEQSVWVSSNPALMSPCHCEADPVHIPHRPSRDQFHPSDPADCQCDHRADHLAVTANPEPGPWPEPIGYAQALLMP